MLSLRNPGRTLRGLQKTLGPAGLTPVAVLMALAAVEWFDFFGFQVLAPNIRDTFHLSNSAFLSISTLSGVLPLLAAVPLGNWADRTHRLRLCQVAGLVWTVAAVITGLAPVVAVLVIARLVAGVGQTVNQPVHPSLLSDYYPADVLPTVFSIYLIGSIGLGQLGSPLSGAIASFAGWRAAFIVLALPALAFVALLSRLREPARGESAGAVSAEETDVPVGEGFRRVRAIRSLQRTWTAAFFFGAGLASFLSIVNLYFKDVYHMPSAERGLVSGATGAVGLLGFALAGRLSTAGIKSGRPERLPVLNGLFVLQFGTGIVLLGVAPWRPLAIVIAAVLGLGASGFQVPYQTMVALVAPPRLRAQAFAWTLVFFTMGAVVFAPIIGAIGDAHGQRAAVVVLGIVVAVGGAIELTVKRFVARDMAEALKLEEAAASTALVSCRGLDVAYDGVQVLFGVDLDIEEGEIVALLGTNGAGKSTLLRAISGLVDPIGGAVYFAGRDVTHADANTTVSLGVVQVPGGRGVFPTLTVADNLRAAAWQYRKDRAYVREATERVLGYFPVLRERWDTEAGSLSGGQQQMLSLAQAFLARPQALLIDELSLGLAPRVVEDLLRIVRAIHDNGTTILLVEQSVNLALQLAQRAVFMEKGEVRFTGPTAELLERPDILRAVFLQGAAANGGSGGTVKASTNGGRKRGRGARAEAQRRQGLREGPAVLTTSGLSKRFRGIAAVQDVDVELHDGEILGLIGPNGAGKTTLFDLICGFIPADEGRVQLYGRDVTDSSANERARLGLGRSFQDARLWPSLTVREAISVGAERFVEVPGALGAMFQIPSVVESEGEVTKRTETLIELLGLGAFRDKFVAELSTGSRRIVEIAAILAHRPSVLLLDEPSSGIAQRESENLGPLLRQVQAHLGCSMLVIEHDMALITGLADHLVAMDMGVIIALGPPEEVLRNSRVVESYLGTASGEIHLAKSNGGGSGSRHRTRARAR